MCWQSLAVCQGSSHARFLGINDPSIYSPSQSIGNRSADEMNRPPWVPACLPVPRPGSLRRLGGGTITAPYEGSSIYSAGRAGGRRVNKRKCVGIRGKLAVFLTVCRFSISAPTAADPPFITGQLFQAAQTQEGNLHQ